MTIANLFAFCRRAEAAKMLQFHRYRPTRGHLMMRRSDGTLWTQGQMSCFWKVREWHGVYIATNRAVWRTTSDDDFAMVREAPLYVRTDAS